jgi:NTE family protein
MDIRYSSRTRAITDMFRTMHDVRHNINSLWDRLPENLRKTPDAKFLYEFGCVTTMDVVELIYRPTDAQGHSKDYEFSRSTMRTRWAQGLSDAQAALLASPWLAPMPPEVGARTFDVLKDVRPTEPPAPQNHGNSARARSEGAKVVITDLMVSAVHDGIKPLSATGS